jgi:hypothetical protein
MTTKRKLPPLDSLGHRTRFSDSSRFDEICVCCGATDAAGDRGLEFKCPRPDGWRRDLYEAPDEPAPDTPAAPAGEADPMAWRPVVNPEFKPGDYVVKVRGYRVFGVVAGVVETANGRRVVVEHQAEGGGSFVHIYAPEHIAPAERPASAGGLRAAAERAAKALDAFAAAARTLPLPHAGQYVNGITLGECHEALAALDALRAALGNTDARG